MGMHVYIPFVCLRCLALLANLLIFGESRDVLQLKVVGVEGKSGGDTDAGFPFPWLKTTIRLPERLQAVLESVVNLAYTSLRRRLV